MSFNANNTEIAFRAKSNYELHRSYWLFKLMNQSWLIKPGGSFLNLAFSFHLPLEWAVRRTIYQQFVGGENIEDCQATIAKLAESKIGTILDYSVEGEGSESDFEQTQAEMLRAIELAAGNPDVPFCVFKVTGLVPFEILEALSAKRPLTPAQIKTWERAKGRVERIGKRAHEMSVRLFFDAEESWIQPAIDHLAYSMMQQFNQAQPLIYNTFQMYRTDRLEALEVAIEAAEKSGYFFAVKLVRGAYMEKERERANRLRFPSPILPDKKHTDSNYDRALDLCLKHLSRLAVCAGTHNEASTKHLVALMKSQNLAQNDPRIYFSQLLGMSDHLSYNLANSGFNVAKYVPYGPVKAVMPYLLRRAEENTAIRGQTNRELNLITHEVKRRRSERKEGARLSPPSSNRSAVKK